MALLLLLSTSGCSVFLPYVGPCRAPRSRGLSYEAAVDCAYCEEDAYSRRATEQAMITPVVGSVLIPLAGAAIGLNVAGTTTDTLAYLGLGGATAISYGTFWRNAPRERAYLSGAAAVNCVIRATRPLNLSAEAQQAFRDDLIDLDRAVRVLAGELAASPDADAQAVLDAGRAALRDGLALDQKLDNVSGELLDAIARIRDAVNEAVRASSQDLTVLVNALRSSLPSGAQSYFGSGFAGVAPAPGGALGRAFAIGVRASSVNDVQQLSDKVNRFIASIRLDGTRNLDSCLATLTSAIQAEAIKIEPATLDLKAGKAGAVVVSGGVPPYVVQVLGPTEVLTATTQAVGRVVHVQVDDAAATGDYFVFISDSTARGVNLKVTVS